MPSLGTYLKPHGYNYHGITIPPQIASELEAWIARGEMPSSFLQAVLSNDLRESFGRASATTRLAMHAIVIYLYNEAPVPCWGSPQKMQAWAARFEHEPAPAHSIESPEDGLLSNLPHDA